MVIETGKPIAEVARDLGIHDGTLGNWVNTWRRAHPDPDEPLTPVEHARVTELEDEIRPAADGERVPERSRGLLRTDAPVAWRSVTQWATASSAKRSSPGRRKFPKQPHVQPVGLVDLVVRTPYREPRVHGHDGTRAESMNRRSSAGRTCTAYRLA
jgi:transposase-like protein